MSKPTIALIQNTTCRGILFCYITKNHLLNVSTRHIFTMLDLCCTGLGVEKYIPDVHQTATQGYLIYENVHFFGLSNAPMVLSFVTV